MLPEKVSAITDWPVPRKVKDIQSFLGFCNFYRRFIWNYSDITIPLTRLTRSNVRWDWSENVQAAFDTLKRAFTEAPGLHHWVPGRQIYVETDASDYAIAAMRESLPAFGKQIPGFDRADAVLDERCHYAAK